MTLHVRWLGRVPYTEALALQDALCAGTTDHLLLLEHPPTYTLGVRARREHVLVDPSSVGAELVVADRGGDVTFHAPGQLVGYPLLTVPGKRGGGMADTVAYVCGVEQLLIDVCADLGLADVGRLRGFPGVWVAPSSEHPRKIAAVGVRLSRSRSKHGFALNVDTECTRWAQHIVPCGLAGRPVTSLQDELGREVTMREVVDLVAMRAAHRWGAPDAAGEPRASRTDVAWRTAPSDLSAFSRGAGPGAVPSPTRGRIETPATPAAAEGAVAAQVAPSPSATSVRLLSRLERSGVDHSVSVDLRDRKPEWMRVKADMGPEYRRLKATMRDLALVTVCEEAGCPNIFECWNDGTATFMALGERCTRACGFCLVDTRKPLPPAPDEPQRIAAAVERLGLAHAVVTMVARDDLADGGAAHIASVIYAVRDASPATSVEVLVSDFRGDTGAIAAVCAARPAVFNHNIETVARLQWAVRPSASYARSLSVLARAKANGCTTKSGMVLGLGEDAEEVRDTLVDLRAVGVDIVTIGQYLRPTTHHLPIARWWTPDEFAALRADAESLGFAHVECSPLTRSSYHARHGAEAAGAASTPSPSPTR